MAIMIPQSWSDCGMDWNNPDPGNIFYALALKEAICERAAVTGINLPTGRFIHLPDLLRLRTFDFIKWVRTSINTLAPYFMDVEYDRYFEKDAPIQETDFPKMYKASEFQEKIHNNFGEYDDNSQRWEKELISSNDTGIVTFLIYKVRHQIGNDVMMLNFNGQEWPLYFA